MTDPALPRLAASSLEDRLRVMPAVVLTGARQTGKSTLAQRLTPGSRRRFLSLDDLDVADAARRDPHDATGLLLHTGAAVEWLAPDVLAAPWWRVL